MYKKIIVGLVITILILAFPTRFLGLPILLELAFKFLKGLIFIIVIFFLLKRENLLKFVNPLNPISVKVLIKLIPVFFLAVLYLYLNKDKIFLLPFNIDKKVILFAIFSTFVLAFAEEIFFRGYLFNLIKKEKSPYKSIIFSSLLFALLHIINFFRYEDLWSVINQIIFAMGIGMLLCSVYYFSNNILLVGVLHFILNLPSSFSKLSDSIIVEKVVINVSTIGENLVSTIFFIALSIPVFMLSIFYIKLGIKENENRHI